MLYPHLEDRKLLHDVLNLHSRQLIVLSAQSPHRSTTLAASAEHYMVSAFLTTISCSSCMQGLPCCQCNCRAARHTAQAVQGMQHTAANSAPVGPPPTCRTAGAPPSQMPGCKQAMMHSNKGPHHHESQQMLTLLRCRTCMPSTS